MRGKVKDKAGHKPGVGITPAYAGKSTHQPPSGRGTRGHPRVCGEKCGYRLPFRSIVGSPPRMRGKALGDGSFLADKGITPACAGKSARRGIPFPASTNHPRVCGEKKPPCQPERKALGSPSRVRGKELSFVGFQPHTRITLACAGKRRCGKIGWLRPWDHPRVCGEKAPFHAWLCCIRGSPSRVRGKAAMKEIESADFGITLACAGKSGISHAYRPRPRDHPRVCGEKVEVF